jgi:hypothetical protein
MTVVLAGAFAGFTQELDRLEMDRRPRQLPASNHPGILDDTHGKCSMPPNAARHAHPCRLRAWLTGAHAWPGRAQNVSFDSLSPAVVRLVASHSGR